MNSDIELIGECHHIFCYDINDSDCIKRYFEIFNIETLEFKTVGICNEYVRLKFHEKRREYLEKYPHLNKHDYTGYNFLDEFLKDECHFALNYCKKDISTFNPIVQYPICRRPYISGRIDLFSLFEIIHNKDHKTYYIHSNLRHGVYIAISNSIRYFIKYKKYAYQRDRAYKILKIIERNSYTLSDEDVNEFYFLINELFINELKAAH